MKRKSALVLLILIAMTLSACSNQADSKSSNDNAVSMISASAAVADDTETTDSSGMFSSRDFENEYDESTSAVIQLNGDSATATSNAVRISGSTITIIDEGTYILSGTLNDGMIIVNSEKTDKTQLVLNGVDIHSETSAPIYILQSDKVFITTAPDSTNTLSNGGSFTAIDESNIDSVIFSKEDLTLNGAGTLVVTSPGGHGVVSKDSLTLTNGYYDINCASHALVSKDNVCIANANISIVSGKDGIHAENADDVDLGFVYIQDGMFTIAAQGDGISGSSYVQIEDGCFDIVAGGGSSNAALQASDSWGNFMGGGRHRGKHSGSSRGGSAADSDTDGTSMKGVKATNLLLINNGEFVINAADDAFHSNSTVTLNGGTFEIASGDDAFHADETLTINAGNINVTESYEGLEGLHVNVAGGNIALVASDDGLNAAGGTDSSGVGGRDGRFGHGMSSSNGSITISGGNLYVNASGDGIDANGTLTISGGFTVVCGPTQGDTATLDYDTSAIITGGTFIGTGASGMAQTFSDSKQGVIAVNVGSQSAGTPITLTDSGGKTVISHTPELSFAVVILSSPDILSGETYTITVGSATGEITAS